MKVTKWANKKAKRCWDCNRYIAQGVSIEGISGNRRLLVCDECAGELAKNIAPKIPAKPCRFAGWLLAQAGTDGEIGALADRYGGPTPVYQMPEGATTYKEWERSLWEQGASPARLRWLTMAWRAWEAEA